MPRKASNPCVHTSVKEAVARFYLNHERTSYGNTKLDAVRNYFNIDVTARTIKNWAYTFRDRGSVERPSSNVGRPRKLSEQEEEIVLGFVITRNRQFEKVTCRCVQVFIQAQFGIPVSPEYARLFLVNHEFSSRAAQTKRKTKDLSVDVQTKVYLKYSRWARENVFAKYARSRIASIDCTYTKICVGTERTYVKKGR